MYNPWKPHIVQLSSSGKYCIRRLSTFVWEYLDTDFYYRPGKRPYWWFSKTAAAQYAALNTLEDAVGAVELYSKINSAPFCRRVQ